MNCFAKICLLVASLSGCVAAVDKTGVHQGQVDTDCINACAEQSKNQKLCTDFAKEARSSCGDLIKKVCEASPASCANVTKKAS